jgi:hypothetical protein
MFLDHSNTKTIMLHLNVKQNSKIVIVVIIYSIYNYVQQL